MICHTKPFNIYDCTWLMFYATLKTIHLMSVIVWIGGMVFAHFFLRPALTPLAAPERLRLMHDVLGRFFGAVLVAAGLVLVSGIWMIGRVTGQMTAVGVKFNMPLEWIAMSVLGVVMMGIFVHIRVVLYPRLSQAVSAASWPAGSAALASIRGWMMVNMVIGVVIVVATLMGALS